LSVCLPRQRDIIWLDFDPTRGSEIRKRRPALVLSRDAFAKATGFIVVNPITSTVREMPQFFTLPDGLKTKGQVVTSQFRSLDATDDGKRNSELIERLAAENFAIVAQMVEQVFDFKTLLNLG